MKRNLLIGLLLISFTANAHLHHNSESALNASTASEYVVNTFGIVRNVGELFSHGYNIVTFPLSQKTIYHGIELTGHGFNVADYVKHTDFQVSAFLVVFNVWAASMQFSAIRKNTKTKTPMALIAAAFGSLDFVGHLTDAVCTARSAWNAEQQS